jgi:hypothetical protein
MKAFVLIQTHGEAVGTQLRSIPGIESTEDVSGPFDAIALVSAGSARELFNAVLPRIREVPGVSRVLPAPLVRSLPSLVSAGAPQAA